MFNKYKTKAKGGLMAAAGFILSPLTWWNDMFINLPLAFGFAYAVGWALSFIVSVDLMMFLALTGIGYFLTNVLGFWLMQRGGMTMQDGRNKASGIAWQKNLLYSLIAFVLVAISVQVGLLDLSETDKLMASILRVPFLTN